MTSWRYVGLLSLFILITNVEVAYVSGGTLLHVFPRTVLGIAHLKSLTAALRIYNECILDIQSVFG